MTAEQKETILDIIAECRASIHLDLAALCGLENALCSYQSAIENDCIDARHVIENALGLRSLDSLQYDYHLKSPEEAASNVFSAERFLREHFFCDIKKIEKSSTAQRAIDNTNYIIDQCLKAMGVML